MSSLKSFLLQGTNEIVKITINPFDFDLKDIAQVIFLNSSKDTLNATWKPVIPRLFIMENFFRTDRNNSRCIRRLNRESKVDLVVQKPLLKEREKI